MLLRGIARASPNPTLFHVGPAFVGAEKASRGRIWPDRIWLTQPNPSQISYFVFFSIETDILLYKQYLAGPTLLQMSLRVNFVHSLCASFSQDYITRNTSRKRTNYYCCTMHRQSENSEYFCNLDMFHNMLYVCYYIFIIILIVIIIAIVIIDHHHRSSSSSGKLSLPLLHFPLPP